MRMWIDLLWIFGYLTTVTGAAKYSLATPPHFIEPNDFHGTAREDGLKCRLRQTMAWRECGGKVACDSTCQKGTDCTFPYCNWLGLCECMPAFCKTDRMCSFFMIDCHRNFTCQNRHCYCD